MKPCLCLPVAMLTVTRHHQFPIPPCSCYKAHCCKASPVPFASSLVNRPLTNHMQHWVYYITSTRWEGVWPRAYRARACNSRTSCIEGDTPLVWHNAHTKLVLVQEKLHQLCGQLWLARSDPQQYVIYGVYVHYNYVCIINVDVCQWFVGLSWQATAYHRARTRDRHIMLFFWSLLCYAQVLSFVSIMFIPQYLLCLHYAQLFRNLL